MVLEETEFPNLLAVAISMMAGLDSPDGASEVHAGQPHFSAPDSPRRLTRDELATIRVADRSARASMTKDVNGAEDGCVGIRTNAAVSPSPPAPTPPDDGCVLM